MQLDFRDGGSEAFESERGLRGPGIGRGYPDLGAGLRVVDHSRGVLDCAFFAAEGEGGAVVLLYETGRRRMRI